MASPQYLERIAIVGAGGNSGRFMAEALLKTGRHTVTAITRTDSESELPAGVSSKSVDYNAPETLVEALRGQDALVITLGGFAPKENQTKLIHAAGEAGVGWILPNEWSPDTANEALVKDVSVFQPKGEYLKAIAELGKSSFVAVVTGFWYEWSLAIPAAYGFDFAKRAVTLFDDGETKICTSTWPQVGRAVAALLSLPVDKPATGGGACLADYANKVVYVNSFTLSQREMLESALCVTNTEESDWTVSKESARERYAAGVEGVGRGERVAFAKMMYTRVFYDDGCGDFESSKGTINAALGLPREDLDEATARAIERSKQPGWV